MKVLQAVKGVGVLNSKTLQTLNSLSKTMDSKTKTTLSSNGCGFTRMFTTGGILKENNNAVYAGQGMTNETYSTVSINDKRYFIDNETGKIVPEKFSLKGCLCGVSKNLVQTISDTINKIKDNFENPDVVEQYSWGISGVTDKGAQKLKESYNRLRNQVKEHPEEFM